MIFTYPNTPNSTISSYRDGEMTAIRGILRRSWNQSQATGTVNDINGSLTPFRSVNNLGDFLNRKNYVCGGPNQSSRGSLISNCDTTGIEGFSGNPKFVSDSSDYVRFKKQRAFNRNYNDTKS